MTLHALRQIYRSFLSKPNMPDGIEKFGCHKMSFLLKFLETLSLISPIKVPITWGENCVARLAEPWV